MAEQRHGTARRLSPACVTLEVTTQPGRAPARAHSDLLPAWAAGTSATRRWYKKHSPREHSESHRCHHPAANVPAASTRRAAERHRERGAAARPPRPRPGGEVAPFKTSLSSNHSQELQPAPWEPPPTPHTGPWVPVAPGVSEPLRGGGQGCLTAAARASERSGEPRDLWSSATNWQLLSPTLPAASVTRVGRREKRLEKKIR